MLLTRTTLTKDHQNSFQCLPHGRIKVRGCLADVNGRQLWRTKENLGRARQERRKAISNWESPMSCIAPREALIFDMLLCSISSQKEGGPIGQPSRQKPWPVTWISNSSVEEERSHSLGIKSTDLFLFRWRSTEGPSPQ